MTRPGDRLREWANRVFSRATMDRVIDPAVADLQAEYHEAIQSGSAWRRIGALLTGYFACVKVITLCGCLGPAAALRDDVAGDRRAFVRTIIISAVAIVIVSALLSVLPLLAMLRRLPQAQWHVSPVERLGWLLRTFPSDLVIAGPVGFAIGLAAGLGGRVVSRRLRAAIVGVAVACSIGALVNLEWIVPAANESFRAALSSAAREYLPPPDINAISRRELTRALASLRDMPGPEHSRFVSTRFALAYQLQFRWAAAIAVVVLAIFVLTIVGRRLVQRWKLVAIMLGALGCYYYLLRGGRVLGHAGDLTAFAAAWLPNAAFMVISAALTTMTRRVQR